MKSIRSFHIVPHIPQRLEGLKRLAENVWYSWHPDCVALFHRLDRDLWEKVNHNPIKLLGMIDQSKLTERLEDEGFLTHLERVLSEFDKYMENKKPYQFHLEKPIDFKIAYFSAEYGLTEALPIYSGGLGVLSGDHLKSASDLNVPLVGVGLLYQKGYFQQYLNEDGWQQEVYTENDFSNMAVKPVRDKSGHQLVFDVWLNNHFVKVRVWLIQVGRVPLYMLDTNFKDNSFEDQQITAQLYGGDREHRLKQEIILGIGGTIALKKMEVEPVVYHMNEGHSAFAALERIRNLIEKYQLTFEEAKQVVIASTVFTTHTPVPAGNDVFSNSLIGSYFQRYTEQVGIPMNKLMELGKEEAHSEFCMTVLAIRLSGFTNGVSQLHKHVSRKMWRKLWQYLPEDDLPIHGITNGIHIPSWISADMAALYDRYLGRRWAEDPDNEKIWLRVESIPDSELWRTHERRRERLVAFTRRRLKEQFIRKGATLSQMDGVMDVLNPEAITIGFARRFATYKRATLLFSDLERLKNILNNTERPVQIIIAGKAHPQDNAGKDFIKRIVRFSQMPEFKNKIAFIENYDINVARYMVEGVDIWLNTPRRPLEACGTSGMKAVANGAIHLSILDGWWDEAYNGQNGWAIGFGEQYREQDYQDRVESNALYQLLENEIIPLYYERSPNTNLPKGWIKLMKSSMQSLCAFFNTHRMVEEYLERAYYEAAVSWDSLAEKDMEGVRDLQRWINLLDANWHKIAIQEVIYPSYEVFEVSMDIQVKVRIFLGEIPPETVQVDIYCGPLYSDSSFVNREIVKMSFKPMAEPQVYEFEGIVRPSASGKLGMTIRILPRHKNLLNQYQLNKVIWA